MGVWVRRGEHARAALDARLDDLHAATGATVTARRPWLECWLDAFPAFQPVVVGVDAADGTLDAVAVLAQRTGRLPRRLIACGHGPSDLVSLPARNGAAAHALAAGLAGELGSLPRGWQLVLRHVDPRDEAVAALAARLGHARVLVGAVSPVLVADRGGELDDYVTGSHRRRLAGSRNRMVRDHLHPQVAHHEDLDTVMALLPELVRVHRLRDLHAGRASTLDVPEQQHFLRSVLHRHLELGQVRLTTLHLEGGLAAYALCFLDGSVVRMWNCRFDPAYARLSPGKVAIDDAVRHALAEGATAYDFMRGAEPYKDSYANAEVVARDLFASSGRVLSMGTGLYLGARDGARAMESHQGRAARAVGAARQAVDRWRVRAGT